MTDPPVTVSRPIQRGEAFFFYIEGPRPPKIGRFAMGRQRAK
ncbi:hypothetical protein [Pseudomonas sp. A34-9]|nr:hypothetical protein [Pseudomonas sp. A34-9]